MGLIGSALGAAGSIFGGISASKAMKKAKQNVQQQMQKNQDWYDRRYNEDATQRADAQRILTMTEESIKNRNRQAAGTQAVMGGTDESTAAAKAANNQALADATAQIAVNGEQRKDQIEQQYLQRDAELNQQLQELEIGRAWKSHATLTLLAKQDLPTFGYNMIAPFGQNSIDHLVHLLL